MHVWTTVARRATVLSAAVATLGLLFPGVAHAAVVASWPMTDAGSPPPKMTDTSGNGHDGTPMGGVTGNGTVFTFNGNGVVVVPDDGSLDPGTRTVSITARIRFTRLPAGDYDIVRKKPAGVKGMQYRMEIGRTGKAKCFFTGDTGSAAVAAVPVLNDGLFHTITCAKTSTTIAITVDSKKKTKSVVVGAISNRYQVSVGAKATGGDDFVGSIDSVTLNYS